MNDSFQTILLVIVLSGLLGGLGAYLAEPRITADTDKPQSDPWKIALPRFIILGLIASACVPLFLSLLQSDIITSILAAKSDDRPSLQNYLLLAGFCLIAAFSSRRFLDSVTAQVLRKAEQAQRDAADAKTTAADAKTTAVDAKTTAAGAKQQVAIVADVIEEQDAQESSPLESLAENSEGLESINSGPHTPASEEDRPVLLALARMTFRSASGVAGDLHVSRDQAFELLESLTRRGLAAAASGRTGVKLWRITPLGIGALSAS